METLKVGASIVISDHIKAGKRKLNYSDIPNTWPSGWIPAIEYLPLDFDLVRLKTNKGRNIVGWSVGKKFDGLKLEEREKVISWHRVLKEDE